MPAASMDSLTIALARSSDVEGAVADAERETDLPAKVQKLLGVAEGILPPREVTPPGQYVE